MNAQYLPPDIENQLFNLELRHAKHQSMLENHREERYQRRERHRNKWHKLKAIPITLV